MGSCLTVTHTCLPCLSSKWVSPCVLCPLWANGGSVNVSFPHCKYMVLVLWEVGAILGDRYGIPGQNYIALL